MTVDRIRPIYWLLARLRLLRRLHNVARARLRLCRLRLHQRRSRLLRRRLQRQTIVPYERPWQRGKPFIR
jgi:hypothetical protein